MCSLRPIVGVAACVACASRGLREQQGKRRAIVNISFTELIVVFVVALLLFGPEQLPQIARGFGKLAAEFRKGSQALRREWYNAVYPPAEEIRREVAEHTKDLRALRAEVLSPPEGSVGSPSKPPKPTDSNAQPTGTPPPAANAPTSGSQS